MATCVAHAALDCSRTELRPGPDADNRVVASARRTNDCAPACVRFFAFATDFDTYLPPPGQHARTAYGART